MQSRKERFVVNEAGQRVAVLLDIEQYEQMVEDLEELADIRAYDEGKREAGSGRNLLDAIRAIETERGWTSKSS